MSSRAAPSRFATAALNAAARSASPAGMPASVAAGAGSLPVAGDETARPIVASQKSARFMGCPPSEDPGSTPTRPAPSIASAVRSVPAAQPSERRCLERDLLELERAAVHLDADAVGIAGRE